MFNSKIISIFILFIGFSLPNYLTAQEGDFSSSCYTENQQVLDFYENEAEIIAVQLMTDDEITISEDYKQMALDALIAIYNLGDNLIVERDSVINCYNVANIYDTHARIIFLESSTDEDWGTELRDGIFPTSNNTINTVFEDYNLEVISSDEFNNTITLTVKAKQNLNAKGLAKLFRTINSVKDAMVQEVFIPCNEDYISMVPYSELFNEITFFKSIPCVDGRTFTFRVYDDCSVRLESVAGPSLAGNECNNSFECATNPLEMDWLQNEIDNTVCETECDISFSTARVNEFNVIFYRKFCQNSRITELRTYDCSGRIMESCGDMNLSANCLEDYWENIEIINTVWQCLPTCNIAKEEMLCLDWLQDSINFHQPSDSVYCNGTSPFYGVELFEYENNSFISILTSARDTLERRYYSCDGMLLGFQNIGIVNNNVFSPYYLSSFSYAELLWDCSQADPNCEVNPPWETKPCNDIINVHIIQIPADITSSIRGSELEIGDWIGVYFIDENGNEVFSDAVQWDGNNLQIEVCGDDPTTAEKDGFSLDELFNWKIKKGDREIKVKAGYIPIGDISQSPVIPDAEGNYKGLLSKSRIASFRSELIIHDEPSCDNPIVLECGDIHEHTNANGLQNVYKYGCNDYYYDGKEIVYQIELNQPADVLLTLSELNADLDLMLLSDCKRNDCEFVSVRTANSDEVIFAPNLAAGIYYVVIDGYGGNETDYILEYNCDARPTGDLDCSDVTTLSCSQPVSGTLNGDNKVNLYNCGQGSYESGKEKIYKFRVQNNQYAQLRLTPLDGQDLDLFVLSGCDSQNDCMATSELGGGEVETITTQILVADRDYYVVVDGFNGAGGDFELTLTCRTRGSGGGGTGGLDCNGEEISCIEPKLNQNNADGSNRETSYPTCSGENTGPELIYNFKNEILQDVVIELLNMEENLNLYVLDACTSNGCYAFGGFRTGSTDERIVLEALPIGDYVIIVDGYNGSVSKFDLVLTCSEPGLDCQEIEIFEGVNYISSYIKPQKKNFDDIFSGLENKIDVIESEEKNTFGKRVNTIGNWNNAEAYKVIANESFIVTICGEKIEENTPIELRDYLTFGADMIPYLKEVEENVDSIFNGNTEIKFLLAWYPEKQETSSFYDPLSPAKTFDLLPGRGYLAYAYNESIINYGLKSEIPTESRLRKNVNYLDKENYFQWKNIRAINKSGYLFLPKLIQENSLIEIGDELGVFSKEGELFASLIFNGEAAIVSVDGKEESKIITFKGFEENEKMYFKLWKKQLNKEFEVEVQFEEGETRFQSNTVKKIKSITLSNLKVKETPFEVSVFPNPAISELNIHIDQPQKSTATIQLLDISGQILWNQKEILDEGFNQVKIDLNNFPQGIYLMKVQSETDIVTQKIVISK